MTNIRHLISLVLLLTGSLTNALGQNIIISQTNENGVYKKGQEIQVKLYIKDRLADTVAVKITINYSYQVTQQKILFTGDTLLIFEKSFTEPTSVICEASNKTETAFLGSIVEPENFRPGTNRPHDFDHFWKLEKTALRALPMDVKMVPVKESVKGYVCFDTEINCTGPKPARGYFAKPVAAKIGTLPIVLFLHAAGVRGAWCRSEPGNALNYAKRGNGALSFDLNAHGMLDGQSEEYYSNLEKGELNNYAQQGIESKKDYYFRGMYLRLIRTLDFLTKQPEWDGKRILVIGQSQGGGQALAAAALDKRVSVVVATLPAMCDLQGKLPGGWPQVPVSKNNIDKLLTTLSYFDAVHLLKGNKATIFVEIGLIDITCRAAGIYTALNQAKGKKIIIPVPYRAHETVKARYLKIWEDNVNKYREDYISDYLK